MSAALPLPIAVTALVWAVAVAAALAAFGAGARAHAGDFVGAAFCRGCHPQAFQQWQRTPHARAFERLVGPARRDPRCTVCHATSAIDGHVGVQCESCHGAGRHYVAEAVMRDAALARAVGLRAGSEPALCERCHTADAPRLLPFDARATLDLVRHRAPGAP